MADEQISALLALDPPPIRPEWHRPPTSDDWQEVETYFGLQFPADYKKLIDCYGTGLFGEFAQIMNPFSQNRYSNLRLVIEHDHLWAATEPERPSNDPDFLRPWNGFRANAKAVRAASPYAFYPARPGLFPWALGSEDRAAVYWLTGGEPNNWPVIVTHGANGTTFERRSEKGCCDLLVQWLRGNVQPGGFPKARLNKDGNWFTSWRMHDADLVTLLADNGVSH